MKKQLFLIVFCAVTIAHAGTFRPTPPPKPRAKPAPRARRQIESQITSKPTPPPKPTPRPRPQIESQATPKPTTRPKPTPKEFDINKYKSQADKIKSNVKDTVREEKPKAHLKKVNQLLDEARGGELTPQLTSKIKIELKKAQRAAQPTKTRQAYRKVKKILGLKKKKTVEAEPEVQVIEPKKITVSEEHAAVSDKQAAVLKELNQKLGIKPKAKLEEYEVINQKIQENLKAPELKN